MPIEKEANKPARSKKADRGMHPGGRGRARIGARHCLFV